MKERALSEVIGFLMIVALLTILFSMYLLYVVPIQGRDAEISHMKYITQEFIGLKADVDGLIINNKINMPIARSFELGTLSSVGMGALSIMPVNSFVESTGTLMVNEQNDFLAVTVSGDMVNISNYTPVQIPSNTPPLGYPSIVSNPVIQFQCDSPVQCPSTPINFTITERFYNLTTKARYSFNDSMIDPATSLINIKNATEQGIYVKYANGTFGTVPVVVPDIPVNVSYDLVLETFDNATGLRSPIVGEKTLIENLTFPKLYTYDLLKDNDLIPNNSSDYFLINSLLPYEYQSNTITTKVERFPPRIGSLSYESSNRYWVNQNLLYEMGGLFLKQPVDGGSSIMLIPSIALTPVLNVSRDADPKYPLKVSVHNIRITDTEDVSGSVSAQIFCKIDKVNENIFNSTNDTESNYGDPPTITPALWKMQEGDQPNAYAVWLQFIPDDPRVTNSTSPAKPVSLNPDEMSLMGDTTKLWKRGFDQIKTITNKTLSDNADASAELGEYTNWYYSFIINTSNSAPNPSFPPYSANLVIGKYVPDIKGACPPYTTDATACKDAIDALLAKRPVDKKEWFILDYADSEVSLVMQSGAL